MPKNKLMGSLSQKSGEESYNSTPKGYEKGKTKYVIVTGSVISGVGKGTFTSCLGNLLKLKHGYNVSPVKFDGYLNYDAGTLNPYRHGEVFVLDDGTECDLDLGTYERMLNKNLSRINYITAGKLFKTIIDKERAGKYLGRDVQFIPHVTAEIKGFLRELAVKSNAHIVLVEVGGTVGDIENSYFLEAMRELAYEEGRENVCFVNVVYILEPGSLNEFKSKAAQLGVKSLMGMGIQPDVVICRSEKPVPDNVREKLSIVANIPLSHVINQSDCGNIHEIPVMLNDTGVDHTVLEALGLRSKDADNGFSDWKSFVDKIKSSGRDITVGITGKYITVQDSYLSILKALEHTAPYCGAKVNVKFIDTTEAAGVTKELECVDGIIVPGGFGTRGTEGKIECIRHARENGIPFLGLCMGFQMAVLEYARNICGMGHATSTELEPGAKEPVIRILPEQEEIKELGGTMRLGGYDVKIKGNTLASSLYGKKHAHERFRHRYNVNPEYIEPLEKKGIAFSGMAPKKRIMQILELPQDRHPFFFATQFHPELSSKPLQPSPVFRGFIEACMKKQGSA